MLSFLGFGLNYYSNFFAFVQKKKKKIIQAAAPNQSTGFPPFAGDIFLDATCQKYGISQR